MKFRVENMTCGGCARAVTAAIREIDPDAVVNAAPADRLIDVTSRADAAQISAALDEAGFPAIPSA
ncbi:heavy metal-associated domain protein [Ketogulonicigenium robustum]|uniref:Heavy metal-associated domain protein n=1 Tax=Ketogulonicigenium robustum TaxID=92947 RepID=A0A1W6NWQ0_9RHOB|nr:heavy-metal-associated domain-containing protein [Ketogulonicigenium robustum]ARO13573.1 heavy metal-associated domain protein [Ketogulonicigenium robustum]